MVNGVSHQRQVFSVCIRASLAALLLCGASLLRAQDWTVQTVPTRVSPSGQKVTVGVAIHTPVSGGTQPVRHVLVYPQSSGFPQLKAASGAVTLDLNGLWMRGTKHFRERGIALVYVDPPSDAEHRNLAARPRREVQQDLAATLKQVQQSFPGARIHLAGFSLVAPLLDVAADLEGFSKIVLVSSALRNSRTSDWSALRKPVLMLQAPGAQCDAAPFLEAQAVAQRNRFTLIQVGYEQQDKREGCGRTSQFALQGQESAVTEAIVNWLEGRQEPPSVIGYVSAQVAWREEVITYQVPGTFGGNQLEATLMLPEVRSFGEGPYPVMVWSHGDVELDYEAMHYKSRIREMTVGREFLQMGVAVLMPARRGAGLSQGSYPMPKNFSLSDADPTYKARVHAEDILPALAWLKTRPVLDANRVILAGQSAGGYATMYLASQNLPGLIGAVDFAGGRTQMTQAFTPNYLNRMMVNGFAEFGQTTRIPTLWVFAENDSRYTAETIRTSYEAFKAAGGKGRLLLNPPIEGDGHLIYLKPALWRAALKEYLSGIGVVTDGN